MKLWSVENEPYISIYKIQTVCSHELNYVSKEENFTLSTHIQYCVDLNVDIFKDVSRDLYYSDCLENEMRTVAIQVMSLYRPISAAKTAGLQIVMGWLLLGRIYQCQNATGNA